MYKANRFRAETQLDQLTEKACEWLNGNYHKLSLTNKIKVSLEIVKRKMPTQLEHSGKVEGMESRVIIIYANKPAEANPNPESRISAALSGV